MKIKPPSSLEKRPFKASGKVNGNMFQEVFYSSVHFPSNGNITPSSHQRKSSDFLTKTPIPANHKKIPVTCCNCGLTKEIVANCGDRTCPYCREKSVRRSLSRKGLINCNLKGLRFLTLTVKSVSDFNREEVDKVRDCFRRLIRRKKWKEYVQGGLYVIEVTKTSKGYHIHLHILFQGKYFNYFQIRSLWNEVTNGSYVIWIEKVKDGKTALNYVLGYVSKVEKSNVEKQEFLKVMKGIKLVQFFGSWTKLKVPKEPCLCPKCKNDEWILDWFINSKFFHEDMEEFGIRKAKGDDNPYNESKYQLFFAFD